MFTIIIVKADGVGRTIPMPDTMGKVITMLQDSDEDVRGAALEAVSALAKYSEIPSFERRSW